MDVDGVTGVVVDPDSVEIDPGPSAVGVPECARGLARRQYFGFGPPFRVPWCVSLVSQYDGSFNHSGQRVRP